MADLARDRGQIILVAAFALAVIFLTLALVVNSAIFTENLASRSDTTGSEEALTNRAVVEQNVGAAVAAANRNTTIAPPIAFKDNLKSFQSQTGQQQATSGQLVNVSYTSHKPGARFDQSTFSDGQLVDDVSRVSNGNGTRAFRANLTDLPGSGSPFTVSIDSQTSNANWTTSIWYDSANGDVYVETKRSDGPALLSETCTVAATTSSTNATLIDITDGTVAGTPCDALGTNETGEQFQFGSGIPSTEDYTISFSGTSGVTGEFSVVANADESSHSASEALYQVTISYTYATDDVRYETDIRVAPGEPDV